MNPHRFLLLLIACLFTAAGAFAKAPPKKEPAKKSPPADATPMNAEAFCQAVKRGHAREATAQAIAELQRQVSQKEPVLDWQLFAGTCVLADDQQLAALRDLLLQYRTDDPPFALAYTAYGTARFRHYAQHLHDTDAKIALPEPRDPLPEAIAADPELKRAWIAWHRACDPFLALADAGPAPEAKPAEDAKPAENAKDAKDTEPAKDAPPAETAQPNKLYTALRQFLAKPDATAASLLPAAYEHADMATKEDPNLGDIPMKLGVLLALLDAERPVEALGAALQQNYLSDSLGDVNGAEFLPSTTPFDAQVAQLFAAAGLDWEEVYAGGMLPTIDGRAPGGDAVLGSVTSWELLAARGSQRGVRLACAAMRKGDLSYDAGLSFIFHVLGLKYEGKDLPMPRKEKLAKDTRREVFEAFGGYLRPERSQDELHYVLVHVLPAVPAPVVAELRPALEKLLQHPSPVIARCARGLMESAHLSLKGLAITPPPPPLRIHVLANDQPVAKTTFTASFRSDQSLTVTTDADGWAEVPITDELHPEAIAKVHLKSIAQAAVKDEHWPGPWLDTTLQVKGQLDRPHTASLRTASLEISLDPQGPVPLTASAQLAVIRAVDAENLWDDTEPELTVPFTGSITLDRVPVGPCCIAVSADGATTYHSKTIDIGKNGAARAVRLERGREVRVTITVPTAHDSGHGFHPQFQFQQNDKPIKVPPTADGKGWAGFPVGKFQMYIDWVQYDGPKAGQFFIRDESTIPANGLETDVSHSGRWTHDFEITADSPAVIDLGKLELTTEEK